MTIKGYELKEGVVIINRDLTELDLFAKKFINVLKKHSDYLVVSGFVSIATGRTRGTEDVDIIVPLMEKKTFSELFKELIKNGFWCYQTDTKEEAYTYLKNFNSIRFALVNLMFPNIELVPFDKTKRAKYFEFSHPQRIKIRDFEFKIPPLEFEILYKEIVLGSKKDLADAKHLRTFFSDIIKKERFKEYEPIVRAELK